MFIQKSLVLFVLGLSALAFVNAQKKKAPAKAKDQRIVGGFVTTIENEPYIIQLLFDNQFMCGGSILSGLWILTAAHCVYGNENSPSRFKIRAGSTYLNKNDGTIGQVSKVIRRQDYDSKTLNNDIALLKLSTALPINGRTIKTIGLCTTEVPTGAVTKASGWGLTSENGDVSNQLRSVYVSKISQDTCKRLYTRYGVIITDMMMCASADGKDSCSGDSGGPLVYNNQLAGVVSWGVGCARADGPGVYAPVRKFVSYINSVMQTN